MGIHKMRKDLANVGHAKAEAKVPVHKEMEKDEDREAKVAAKKQHIQKTLSKLLADVENSDKYSDEKKGKVEELVHKMRQDLAKVGSHKEVKPMMDNVVESDNEKEPVVDRAEKKARIQKTLSKLLADVENSDKYSDEKKAKVEALVHKMRKDVEASL